MNKVKFRDLRSSEVPKEGQWVCVWKYNDKLWCSTYRKEDGKFQAADEYGKFHDSADLPWEDIEQNDLVFIV